MVMAAGSIPGYLMYPGKQLSCMGGWVHGCCIGGCMPGWGLASDHEYGRVLMDTCPNTAVCYYLMEFIELTKFE